MRAISDLLSTKVSPDEGFPAPLSSIRTKVRTLVTIADSSGSSISSAELLLLLPAGAFPSADRLEEFVTHDPSLSGDLVVSGGEIALKGSEYLAHQRTVQASQTALRLSLGLAFSNRFAPLCPWLRLVAISGSTAYGRTKAIDDIDFFMVTERSRLWITLLLAMLTAKVHRLRNPADPVYCFNRILDDSSCAHAFRMAQEPLFAREALNLRVVVGQSYYRSLLHSAPWMGDLFPDLYRKAVGESDSVLADAKDGRRTNLLWSFANGISFAALAPYLALVNLWRNFRLRRAGNASASFRTIIRRGFFAYESRRYDLLRDMYRRAF